MSRFSLTALFTVAALALAPGAKAQTPDLSELHDALHLTPAQQAAWRDFADASAGDPAQEARDRSAEAMLPTLSAPRRVDLSIAVARAELDSLERRGAAVKLFYGQLTPAQQAIFDRETAPRRPGD